MAQNELYHVGVKGMKWGVRKERPAFGVRRRRGRQTDYDTDATQDAAVAARKKRAKKAAIIGGSIVAAGLAAYGATKLYQISRDRKLSKAVNVGRARIDRLQVDRVKFNRF